MIIGFKTTQRVMVFIEHDEPKKIKVQYSLDKKNWAEDYSEVCEKFTMFFDDGNLFPYVRIITPMPVKLEMASRK